MAYLLDANVFIEAKDGYYGFDFCPAFWDWLKFQHRAKRVFSVEKVRLELVGRGDELSRWARTMDDSFFLHPEKDSLAAFAAISDWLDSQPYESSAVNAFLSDADYFLVAQARHGTHTVVSREVPGFGKRKVKIPNVCIGLGVKCISTFDLLRQEHARFVLAPGAGGHGS